MQWFCRKVYHYSVYHCFLYPPTKNKIAHRYPLKRCASTRGELLDAPPNLFEVLINWKSVFSSFCIFIPYLSRSVFILNSMIHSLILVLSPANKNKEQIIKNIFFLSTNSSSCMLFLKAHKWPGNPTSLGLERQLRKVLLILPANFYKEISYPFILMVYFLP